MNTYLDDHIEHDQNWVENGNESQSWGLPWTTSGLSEEKTNTSTIQMESEEREVWTVSSCSMWGSKPVDWI